MAGRESKPPPLPGAIAAKAPETLAERFWSLAHGMERDGGDSTEPVKVVEHVLRVLDALDAGKVGRDLTANTINFLAMLRQYEMKGDLMYASPEQARGEQVDERSLVFSVGVLLFEKLTGRHPFGAEGNPQRLARIRRGEIGSGVNYFPMVPAELRVVLVKAMGPFPEERWGSLQEMRQHLEMFMDRSRHPDDYSAPKSMRPLPALPADEDQTKFVPRARVTGPVPAPAEPSVDLPRMARATAQRSALRLETQPAEIPAQPAQAAVTPPVTAAATTSTFGASVVETSLAPKRRFGGVVVGMAVGAAAASIGFWAAWPTSKGGAPAAAPAVAAAPAPVVTTMPSPPTPTPTPAQPQTQTQTKTPAPPPAPTPTPVAEPSPSPSTTTSTGAGVTSTGVFDVQVGGRNALAAARTCIAKDRPLQIGVSLLIDAKTGTCKKVYFGSSKEMTPADRSCLQHALIGIDAGGPPKKGAVINTSLHLSPRGDQVKAKLEATP